MQSTVEPTLSGTATAVISARRDKFHGEKSAIRMLTVSTVHRECGGSTRSKHSLVPALRLNGQWLGKFGFAPGQKVQVKIGQGSILITVTSHNAL